MKLISGNSNKILAEDIAKMLNTKCVDANITKFADGEISVEIYESIRGEDVFIVQSTSYPVNDNLMELLVIIDALKRASAKSITAVIPYFGYARQDRKSAPRTPITAKLVANLLTTAGVNKIITLDLHATQIQGFFDIPVDNLFGNILFVEDIKANFKDLSNVIVVSPDIGGVLRARSVAKWLESDLAIIDKRRPKAGVSEVVNIIGDVAGKHCLLIDDIADSAGTLCNSANALAKHGALDVYAYVTHGVFSPKAMENINNSAIKEFVLTNSIDGKDKTKDSNKIRYIGVAKLLAEAINRSAHNSSLSDLFLR
jgi:ribose-phosphate pyrophosphokinase